jgi:hypothetical protein
MKSGSAAWTGGVAVFVAMKNDNALLIESKRSSIGLSSVTLRLKDALPSCLARCA